MASKGVSRGIQWSVVALFWLVSIPALFSQTNLQNRITEKIDRSRMVPLQGHVSSLARIDYDQGRVTPSMPMQGVSLYFKPSTVQQKALQKLLADQQNPSSPNFHKWLTPEQYASRFGMSQEDLTRVTSWLQSQGFTSIKVGRNHNRISFDGTAALIDTAFETEIHQYNLNGETRFANSVAPSLPEAMASTVLGLRHLNNFAPKQHSHQVPQAHFTSNSSGNHFISPADFATIYNIKPLYDAGFDGTGVAIAVVGQTQINVSDTNKFRSLSGLSVNPPQIVLVPDTGTSTSCTSDLDEANLDVQWSGAVAKNATVLYVYSGVGTTGKTCANRDSGVFDSLQYVIENDLAPVIGMSYGLCESQFGLSDAQIIQGWVQTANAQGQTLSAAAGDSGAADCDTGATATHGLAVDIPAAIPEVTAIGGTEFSADVANPATYWNPASGSDLVDSVISYIPEMAWNDSPVTGLGPTLSTTLFAGGGGVSTFFSKPSWQTGTGVPADGFRDVPDVSLNASPNHDGFLTCSKSNCVNGFRASDGSLTVFGGTSVSSQLFAGVLAIINQATESGGLGNANIKLYSLATSTPAAFHDITTGNIKVPCTVGSTNCPAAPAAAIIGYSAGAKYDLATGLGSIDVDKLTRAWQSGSAGDPSFSLVSDPAALTIASAGTAAHTTISVASTTGFSGAVNLTCVLVPLNSLATCSVPASVTLDGSATAATATLNVTTTAAHAASNTSASVRFGWITAATGTLFAGMFLIGVPSRRRGAAILGLLICVLLIPGMGCGGGSSSSSGGGGGSTTPTTPGTPAGTYTVTVTGTNAANTISHSVNITVTVQ